jgi:hypothetical protein
MDRVRQFLGEVKARGVASGNLLGLLNVVMGRRIADRDGNSVCAGITWREMATLLKRVRWDPDAVTQLGFDPNALPPRDRERYWYAVIAQAGVDSAKATAAGEQLAEELRAAGYDIGPPPGSAPRK